MKYKVVIKQIIESEFEMELENESIMGAYDEALELVAARSKVNIGRFFISKVSKVEE